MADPLRALRSILGEVLSAYGWQLGQAEDATVWAAPPHSTEQVEFRLLVAGTATPSVTDNAIFVYDDAALDWIAPSGVAWSSLAAVQVGARRAHLRLGQDILYPNLRGSVAPLESMLRRARWRTDWANDNRCSAPIEGARFTRIDPVEGRGFIECERHPETLESIRGDAVEGVRFENGGARPLRALLAIDEMIDDGLLVVQGLLTHHVAAQQQPESRVAPPVLIHASEVRAIGFAPALDAAVESSTGSAFAPGFGRLLFDAGVLSV